MKFRRVYPNTPSKLFFDGGLNSKFEKSLINENESPDCLNVVFEDGSVGTRGGTSKLNTTSVGSFSFDGFYTRQDKSGSETMVAFANGSAYYLGTTTFITIPSAQSVFTAGFRVGCAQAENYAFFGNGGVEPYKYNGTTWTRHGIFSPVSACTTVSQATGILTGDYLYKMTNVNSASVESDVSPVGSTITAASATIRVGLPVAPTSYGVASRKLYRTEAGGTTYKFLTTISNNTDTYYDDSTADGSLGTAAPTDNGVPPKWSVAVWHAGTQRMFMNDVANENYLWYSEAGNPYTVEALNFEAFGDKATDVMVSFVEIENGMLVTCRKRSYLWYFPDNNPANWVKSMCKVEFGTRSPYAIVNYANGVFFPAAHNDKFVGFAHMLGNNISPDATILTISTIASEYLSEKIEPIIFSTNNGYLNKISCIVYENRIYMSIPYGSGQTTNNRVLVFDYSYSRVKSEKIYSWSLWDGMNAAQFTVYNGKLYYAASNQTGFVYEMNTDVYSDDGTAINSYFSTKDFAGFVNETENHKDFRFANLLVDMAGTYSMDIVINVDTDKGVGVKKTISLDPESTTWNSFRWGNTTWGGGNYQKDIKVDLGNLSGKRIQFKFTNQNTAGQRFKVHYGSYTYNLKGLR